MSTPQFLTLAGIIIGLTYILLIWSVLAARRRVRILKRQNRTLVDRMQQMYEVPAISDALSAHGPLALIINPSKSGAREIKAKVTAMAKLFGISQVNEYETTVDDPGGQAARAAIADGAKQLIVAGGDGTVRAVAEEMIPSDVEMAILPLGTGNLLARNMELPVNDMDACLAIAFNGRSKVLDGIAVELHYADGTSTKAASMVITGVGFDAEIMSDTSDALKQAAGWLAYTEAGMRKFASGERRQVVVTLDDHPPKKMKVRSIMVANCGLLTGGINLAPEAEIDDGLLDVVMMSPSNLWDWMRMAGDVMTRRKDRHPVLETIPGKKVSVEIPEPWESQIDGDSTGKIIGFSAEVKPHSVRVRMPRNVENSEPL